MEKVARAWLKVVAAIVAAHAGHNHDLSTDHTPPKMGKGFCIRRDTDIDHGSRESSVVDSRGQNGSEGSAGPIRAKLWATSVMTISEPDRGAVSRWRIFLP